MLAPIAAVVNQSDSSGGKMSVMKNKSLKDVQKVKPAKDFVA